MREQDPTSLPYEFARRDRINLTEFLKNPRHCKQQADLLQRSVAVETIKVRGIEGVRQYGRYFASFWAYGLADATRARLIRSSYFWLRHVDDIADRDKPLPYGFRNRQVFLDGKRTLIEKIGLDQSDPLYGDREDILLADYFLTAEQLGIDLREESLAILDAIMFDEERSRTRRVPIKQELNGYFDRLDFACGSGALKVAGESCPPEALIDLSLAVRTMFNLRDFPQDFGKGIINIPAEDIEQYGIDLEKCEGKSTVEELLTDKPMRNWYRDQVLLGLSLLLRAKDVIRTLSLKRLTRLALWISFERPTERMLREYQQLLA